MAAAPAGVGLATRSKGEPTKLAYPKTKNKQWLKLSLYATVHYEKHLVYIY